MPRMATNPPRSPSILALIPKTMKTRIRIGYLLDPLCQGLRGRFAEIDGLMFIGDCLVLPADPVLRLKLVESTHHRLGHANASDTIANLRCRFVWRGMSSEVKIFTVTCPTMNPSRFATATPIHLPAAITQTAAASRLSPLLEISARPSPRSLFSRPLYRLASYLSAPRS
ncbi:hypothetical protein PTTG_28364 [Puccinia triticina 1-1 BBBD Race 1]|uniref:Integrase_H2C2 domain-containing protein n=1 Tax=Puccinia triticina (isolate 1-1 / race 1 (BBBD)) TaxID=630390 RepID=A0A180GCG1_PUCT1|nr:hypothetical protein PTTG_28364 [Puccinia triticina 1-1 BBBD Race 1]